MQGQLNRMIGGGLVAAACVPALGGCGEAGAPTASAADAVPAALVNTGRQSVAWRVVDSAHDKATIVVRPEVGEDWPCVAYASQS